MANTSVGGLISGLDTATIISQLMQLEAQPQTALKSKVTATQSVVTALQGINSKLASLTTKATDLSKASGWTAMKATSSNQKVTVTADATAVPATLSFTVQQTATAPVLDLGLHSLTDQVMADGSTMVSLTKPDGTTVDVDTKDGTVKGLVSALNAGSYGVSATMVQVSSGSYRLQVAASTTGDKPLALAAPSGSTSSFALTETLTNGTPASIKVGADTILSDSNTFTDLMPGVDVTLGAGSVSADPVTITVGRDAQAISDSVKSMVDAVNAVLADIDKGTAYDATSKSGGVLLGDAGMRGLRDNLLSSVFGGTSLASVGVQTDRSGKLVFDATAFQKAYNADPVKTAAQFTDNTAAPVTGAPVLGFAARLAALGKTASNSVDGTVTQAIAGRNSSIKSMQKNIDDWDVRLTAKQAALQKQYAALEVALGKMQDQASWLSGQISSLPKMG